MNRSAFSLLVLTLVLTAPAQAQLRPSDAGTWYYEIGGADPYMFGYTNRTRVSLGLGANWSVGNACSFEDRKSTRLNSSHVAISYAVFCLKKKIKEHKQVSSSQRGGD